MRMRNSLIVGLSAVAIIGMSACGGTSGGETVARVRGVGAISEAALNHWTQVEAVLVHELVPLHPAPRGLIPDPPRYTACISYLRRVSQQAPGGSTTLTSAVLKRRCRQRESELRANTLNKLISWEWTIGRGKALGMRVTDAQARRRLAQVIKGHVVYGPNFKRYLKLTGQTMADMLFRSRVQLYEVQLDAKGATLVNELPKTLTEDQRQSAIAKLAKSFIAAKSWVAKTSCSPRLVVSACKQYTGSEEPPGAAS